MAVSGVPDAASQKPTTFRGGFLFCRERYLRYNLNVLLKMRLKLASRCGQPLWCYDLARRVQTPPESIQSCVLSGGGCLEPLLILNTVTLWLRRSLLARVVRLRFRGNTVLQVVVGRSPFQREIASRRTTRVRNSALRWSTRPSISAS